MADLDDHIFAVLNGSDEERAEAVQLLVDAEARIEAYLRDIPRDFYSESPWGPSGRLDGIRYALDTWASRDANRQEQLERARASVRKSGTGTARQDDGL